MSNEHVHCQEISGFEKNLLLRPLQLLAFHVCLGFSGILGFRHVTHAIPHLKCDVLWCHVQEIGRNMKKQGSKSSGKMGGKASAQASRSLASAAAANSPTLKIFACEAVLILLDKYDICIHMYAISVPKTLSSNMQEIDRKSTNESKWSIVWPVTPLWPELVSDTF